MRTKENPSQSPPISHPRPRTRTFYIAIALAAFATTIAFIYSEENWRGKRAWENCKRELEAKGRVLDWSTYIPPAVPDEQNFFKAPKMQAWFVGRATNELSEKLVLSMNLNKSSKDLIAAELTLVPADAQVPLDPGATVLSFDDPQARQQCRTLIRSALGSYAVNSANATVLITVGALDQIKPARIILRAGRAFATNELQAFAPESFIWRPRPGQNGSNSFQLLADCWGHCTAADFLARTDQCAPELDLVCQALKRPYARMDGDYRIPFQQPIPSFVSMRAMAQMLTMRAQCHLLLGQPDQAMRELTMIHQLCQVLGPRPLTLVAAMINVGVTGSYLEVVQDGLRRRAWREPQITELELQLKEINLYRLVADAMAAEQAGVVHGVEMTPVAQVMAADFDPAKKQKLSAYSLVPRGWVYQNMAVFARAEQEILDNLDPSGQVMAPEKVAATKKRLEDVVLRNSAWTAPFTFLARIGIPNVQRAFQVLSHTQTLASQCRIACALELYHMAHGSYPETLEGLTPQFKIPSGFINGQPPRYRRLLDDKFLLYSLGWSGVDHGGVVADSKKPLDGDWVWSE
jgi:hypothetical protein